MVIRQKFLSSKKDFEIQRTISKLDFNLPVRKVTDIPEGHIQRTTFTNRFWSFDWKVLSKNFRKQKLVGRGSTKYNFPSFSFFFFSLFFSFLAMGSQTKTRMPFNHHSYLQALMCVWATHRLHRNSSCSPTEKQVIAVLNVLQGKARSSLLSIPVIPNGPGEWRHYLLCLLPRNQ